MKKRRNLNVWPAIIMFLLLMVSTATAETIYVDDDATGANDGSSWADAYNYLQDALTVALSGDEIWVAEGVYKPDQGTNQTSGDKDATFQLKNGVAIKGGYAGFGQPDPNARDIEAYETILNGDLNSDDVSFDRDHLSRLDNSYHVVTGSGTDETAVLDGFTIRGGNAAYSARPESKGGGMHSYRGRPTVSNCTFTWNSAYLSGGGMYNTESSPTVTDCIFRENNASGGGAVYNVNASSPRITGCLFRANTARHGAGIAHWNGGNAVVVSSTFTENYASEWGGVMECYASDPTFINCLFYNNEAVERCGAMCICLSSPTVINCTFGANGAGNRHVQIYRYSYPTFANCIMWDVDISGNEGTFNYCCVRRWDGAGTGNIYGQPRFVAPDQGNFHLQTGSPCIDAGDNSALPAWVTTDLDGDLRYTDDPSTVDKGKGTAPIVDMGAYECPKRIFRFSLSPGVVRIAEGATATFTVALAQPVTGSCFVSVSRTSGDADISVVSSQLLTFDASNWSQPQTVTLAAAEDADNLNGRALIGLEASGFTSSGVVAVESDSSLNTGILFVDDDAGGGNNGSSWTDALTELQQALSIARDYPDVREIRVAQGIYRPAGVSGDRTATFQLLNNLGIKGGYAGVTESRPDARDIRLYKTVLSGDLNGDDTDVHPPEQLLYEPTRAENCYHVVTGSGTNYTAVLEGCTITAGNAVGGKPGWKYGSGGGMYNQGGGPTVLNCIFIANIAGGAAAIKNRDGSNPTIVNCLLSGNAAEIYGGGAMTNDQSSPTLINCTISGNWACCVGGIYNAHPSSLTLINSIIRGNNGSQIGHAMGNPPTVQNCLIGDEGTEDPLFVDADGADNVLGTEDDDLRLLPGSPCLNAGYNAAIITWAATDLDGDPRIADGTVDIGAYEGPDQGFVLSTQSMVVNEGQQETFTVALVLDPLGPIEVTVAVESGDTDIIVALGEKLYFDSSNYSQPQTVTVFAAEDEDYFNGTARIWISSPGFYTAGVDVMEWDNEAPAVLYVDNNAPGANDGTNWTNAFTNLHDALSVAAAVVQVEEIKVAQGVYKPTGPSGDRNTSFQLVNGVSVKGGYAGCRELDPNVRNIDLYETILSGDLNGDDVEVDDPCDLLTEATRSENSYHVVMGSEADESAVLDGFTIIGGNANGPSSGTKSGGGIGGLYGEVSNCIITGNSASRYGGGISGGGIVTNCIFIRNSAEDGGGASHSEAIIGCTFIRNYANECGGGTYGGAILSDCVFIDNSADWWGGGVCSGGEITGCTFLGNWAGKTGGGYDGTGRLNNCVFTGNQAGKYGGAVYTSGEATEASMSNCTLSGNWAGLAGGGICNQWDNLLTLTNCILWNNDDEDGADYDDDDDDNNLVDTSEIYDTGYGATTVATYSCIQGGWTGLGNIDVDPLFVEPGYWADANDPNVAVEPNDPNAVWVNGDYHLKSEGWRWDANRKVWTWDDVTSPCIDAGNPGCALGDELLSVPDDPNNEWGENLRINMGAYGGTAEASMALPGWALLADLTNDRIVDFNDLAVFVEYWLDSGQCIPGDLNRNESIDFTDFALMAFHWLEER